MSTNHEVISGRRDWDVVAFADYERDTAEITQQATSRLSAMSHEIDELRRTLALVVYAAGGSVCVTDAALYDAARLELTVSRNDARREIVFEASTADKTPRNG